MHRRNMKLINFQAIFLLFTLQFSLKAKKFQQIKKILVNLFLQKQYYVRKWQDF